MKIVQITPGAGGMYCGNCFRDNALVASLRRAGHSALMIPLYLPLTLEEEDASAGTPLFFSGVNVYLEEKLPWFRHAPAWLHRWLASPWLLRRLAGRAASTRPAELGGLTLSMLQGELGHQAREVDDLVTWLDGQEKPDVICLSNALLIGMARSLQERLGVPVACMLQGEDSFLESLPEPYRKQCWSVIAERAREVRKFIAPSRYFADLMSARLDLKPGQVEVVPNGINLDGYQPSTRVGAGVAETDGAGPVLGYFARMCREKGLDLLVEAFVRVHRRGRVPSLRLAIGGGSGPGDVPFVNGLRETLRAEGLLDRVSFHPNLDRTSKLAFLRGLSMFSVPAGYGEAFGLYLVEALAAGVPVVQPRQAAFPELVEATGGGMLCAPNDAEALAQSIEGLALDPARRLALGEAGRRAVASDYSVERMMERMVGAFRNLLDRQGLASQAVPAKH